MTENSIVACMCKAFHSYIDRHFRICVNMLTFYHFLIYIACAGRKEHCQLICSFDPRTNDAICDNACNVVSTYFICIYLVLWMHAWPEYRDMVILLPILIANHLCIIRKINYITRGAVNRKMNVYGWSFGVSISWWWKYFKSQFVLSYSMFCIFIYSYRGSGAAFGNTRIDEYHR